MATGRWREDPPPDAMIIATLAMLAWVPIITPLVSN